jgi:hypothetical protein
VTLPKNWPALVNRVQTEAEQAALRHSIVRGTPYGSDHWTKLAASAGIEFPPTGQS